jgi:hypothetical protein
MLHREQAAKALGRLFKRRSVARIEDLCEALGTHSRMSVFRRLKELGYFSSFTHAGRYYTLSEIPRFDLEGLWFWEDIGFSKAGTLKRTLVERVQVSEAGATHAELARMLRIRLYNTLLDLWRKKQIGRERLGAVHLYVSADESRAAEQILRREEIIRIPPSPSCSPAVTMEVLAEALRASHVMMDADVLVQRLSARGVQVTVDQVREVYERYGLSLEKKTAEQP